MAIPFEILTPHVPMHPYVGAVVAGKVMVAQSQVQTGHTGRFVVIDPIAETIRAFQMTAPAGFSFGSARFGDEADGALWMACNGGTYLMLVEMLPDGSYFTHPSGFGAGGNPRAAVHVPLTNEIWCISMNTAAVPRIFDLSTRAWKLDTPTSGASFGQPLYASGAIWCPTGSGQVVRYDAVTRAKTTPVTSGGPNPAEYAQGVVNGSGVAIWPRGSSGYTTLDLLDTGSSTPSQILAGVPFYAGLAISDEGTLYSGNAGGSTIAKHSLIAGSDTQATGVTGGSNGSLTFWAGRGVAPVWKA